MPLDDAGFVIPPRFRLDELGFIAISEERAEAWRQSITKAFCDEKAYHQHLFDSGRAYWHTVHDATQVSKWMATAPRDVRQLARTILTTIPDVKLSVQWFYEDPLLYASMDDAHYCMAIWHRGVVRAIAAGATLWWGQRVLRVWAKTV